MKPSESERVAHKVHEQALELGFDAVGVCNLAPIERGALRRWLERGFAAGMSYMHRQAPKRENPASIVAGASRAVVVLKSYYHPRVEEPGLRGRISRYAWGEDYHLKMGERLARLGAFLVRLGGSPQRTGWFVDAGPVPERALAQRAGLGWIGKNTMLINRRLGSFTFIGSVFTDLEIELDSPFVADRCGSCVRCLEACPAQALVAERELDARRCISYLTVEHRGDFPAASGNLIGEWVFGCDLCQSVCPWNAQAKSAARVGEFSLGESPLYFDLEELSAIDERSFALRYGKTALKRAGASGLRRNARQVRWNLEASGKDSGAGEILPGRVSGERS